MRNKNAAVNYYTDILEFKEFENVDFDGYKTLVKVEVKVYYFQFKELHPK
jgi:hypothetical protein